MSVSDIGTKSCGDDNVADVTIVCLGCYHESTSVREHWTHVARADHDDEGETYR